MGVITYGMDLLPVQTHGTHATGLRVALVFCLCQPCFQFARRGQWIPLGGAQAKNDVAIYQSTPTQELPGDHWAGRNRSTQRSPQHEPHVATRWLRHDDVIKGNIFRVTGHLCGEFIGPRWIPRTKAIDAELDILFDLRLNKRLSKQSWGWWFETPSRPLWRHRNVPNCTFAECLVIATLKGMDKSTNYIRSSHTMMPTN